MNDDLKQFESTDDRRVRELNTKFDDPLMTRKRESNSQVQNYNGIPLPSIVEISESGTCNRTCSFCPRSAPNFEDKKEFINESLSVKLADQLNDLGYRGLILFSGFVEPLLDKNLPHHIRLLKIKNPDVRIEAVTNGDPITIKNLNALHEAGLDALLVSCYDGEHQIAAILNKVRRSKFPEKAVMFRKRWGGSVENFGISLSNRGGLMSNAEFQIGNLKEAWNNPCFYPANTFFLDYNGDVLMCSHDWGRKQIVGNLKQETFLEIWQGPRMSGIRKMLLNGDRSVTPCNICNVQGTRMGVEHANAWTSFFEGSR